MKNRANHDSQQMMIGVAGPINLSVSVFKIFPDIVRSGLAIFIFIIFLSANVFAQDFETLSANDSSSSGKKFNHAINMCPGGIAFGIYSVNYEHLFGETHGLVFRLDYESVSESYNNDSIKANGFAFILNYRWHWTGGMDSMFLGSFLRYRHYKGTGTSDTTEFDFTMPEFTLGLNVGKRWIWSSGFNINVAFGYGISTYSTESQPSNSSIESTLNNFVDEYSFLGPFLGEFSLGYAF